MVEPFDKDQMQRHIVKPESRTSEEGRFTPAATDNTERAEVNHPSSLVLCSVSFKSSRKTGQQVANTKPSALDSYSQIR